MTGDDVNVSWKVFLECETFWSLNRGLAADYRPDLGGFARGS